MKTIINIVNIPSDIYRNVKNVYTFNGEININKNEGIVINDYIKRIVKSAVDTTDPLNTFCKTSIEPIGSLLGLKCNILNVRNIISVKEFTEQSEIDNYLKIIYVEYTSETIDEIRKLLDIDDKISAKAIDFGDK